MRTLLALALLATFVVQAATPREAPLAASPVETLRGVPHAATWKVGAGIETRPLQRPGGSGLGYADGRGGSTGTRPVETVTGSETTKDATGGTPSTPAAALPSTGAPVSVPAITPEPSSGLTGPAYSASATWCAPTPTQCQSWGGNAMFGAVFSFRDGDRPYWVHVTRGERFADVLVVSFCACRGTLNAIDLSPAAFERLAPLSRGRIDVTVEVLNGPAVTLPPTDTPDQHPDDPPAHPDDDRMRDEVSDTLYEGGTE